MYLIYTDESGDDGLVNSPAQFFVISALVMHESSWLNILDDLIVLRKYFLQKFGLRLKDEIHSGVFINGKPKFKNSISRNNRLDILKQCLVWLDKRNDISITTVRVDKSKGGDVFDFGWRTLIQRLENTLMAGNFPGGATEKGVIFSDNTNEKKLTRLLREMRRHNFIPDAGYYGGGSRNIRLRGVIEDPVMRNSANSFLHQMADVVAYFARQVYEPNKYVRRKGARTFYKKIQSITNPHATKYSTNFNIVEL